MDLDPLSRALVLLASTALVAACGGSSSSSDSLSVSSPTVRVSGLDAGHSVTVELDGDESLTIDDNTSRSFQKSFVSSKSYTVTIVEAAGTECGFGSSGSDTFNGSNAGNDNIRVRCGDEMGSAPDDGDDGPGEEDGDEETVQAGNLQLIASSMTAPDFVSMAFRIADTNGGFAEGIVDTQLSVTAGGHPVSFNPPPAGAEGDRIAHLDAAPNIKRVIRVYVDVSRSMPPDARDDIVNALVTLHEAQQSVSPHPFDRRMKFYWFDEETVEIVTFVDDFGNPQGVFANRMPPYDSAKSATNVLQAIRNAREGLSTRFTPMHLVTEDAVVITDGHHNVSNHVEDSELETLRQSLENRRVRVIAYGEEPDAGFLEDAVGPERLYEAGGLNELEALLLDVMDSQDQRMEGIHFAHTMLPERQGSTELLRLSVTDTGLCPEQNCTVSTEYNPSSLSSERGTVALASRENPYEGEKFRLMTLPWRDEYLGCTGAPDWVVVNGEDETPIGDVDDLTTWGVGHDILVGSSTPSSYTFRVKTGGGACEHDLSITARQQPEPEF